MHYTLVRSGPFDSLRDLSNELEKIRVSDEKKGRGILHYGRPLAHSTPSMHSKRLPSPTCRITDMERDKIKTEQRLSDKVKTVLCTQYMKMGKCEYGYRCRFAHGYEELRLRKVPSNYKTVLCQNFERDGCCRYGKRCQFIHRVPSQSSSFDEYSW